MLGDLGVAGQSSYGTLNVTSLRTVPIVKETLALGIDQLLDPSLYGRFGESPRYSGRRSVSGAIDFVPMPTNMGTMFYAALGVDTVSFVGSVATHKFKPLNTADWDSTAALPPFSILVNRDVGSSMLYYDLCATGLKLDIANGEFVKGTVDWIGGKYADNAKVAASFPVEKEWTWDTFSVSYGGQGMNVRKMTLEVKNNLETIFWLGNSVYPAQVKRKSHVQIMGSLTLQFQSNSHMADFFTQSQPERQVLVNFLSVVASPASLKLDIPSFRWMKWPPQITGPGALEVTADWVGAYNTTSSYAFEASLTNTLALYP
jgi:hypothetical protein